MKHTLGTTEGHMNFIEKVESFLGETLDCAVLEGINPFQLAKNIKGAQEYDLDEGGIGWWVDDTALAQELFDQKCDEAILNAYTDAFESWELFYHGFGESIKFALADDDGETVITFINIGNNNYAYEVSNYSIDTYGTAYASTGAIDTLFSVAKDYFQNPE